MWYLYLLRCRDRSLYVGTTTDLARRLKEHRSGKGAAYTRARLPVALVHLESHRTRSRAQRREAHIKQWPRASKLALVRRRAAR